MKKYERKTKQDKHILTILRGITGHAQTDIVQHGNYISYYENNKKIPNKKTIYNIAKKINVNPDILFYSFGILPEKEMKIIKSDPFYYMAKIQELCNNHHNRYHNRYGDNEVDLGALNHSRALDYYVNRKVKNEDKSES